MRMSSRPLPPLRLLAVALTAVVGVDLGMARLHRGPRLLQLLLVAIRTVC